jgi:hypothetical protein
VQVKQPNVLLPVTSVVDVKCNGDNSGSASANVTGGTPGYNYSWSTIPPLTTAQAPGLKAGTYTVTVTDSKGCTITATAVVNEPAAISFTTGSSPASSCGNIDGSSSVTGTAGGSAPYTYQWNTTPAQNSATATGLSAGGYVVTVTDSKGCTKTAGVNVNDTGAPSLTSTQANATCNKSCDGSATASATGGASPYTYLWTTGNVTTPTITGLCAGNHTVTVTDNVGCKAVKIVTITEPVPVKPVVTKTGDTLTSTPAVTYQWYRNGIIIGGATNQKYVVTQNGKYIVTVTDNNGCTGSSDTINVVNVGISAAMPGTVTLEFYPNPFSDQAALHYTLPSSSFVTIELYNLLGERVAVISDKTENAGDHRVEIGTISGLQNQGIYFLKFRVGNYEKTIRIIKTY